MQGRLTASAAPSAGVPPYNRPWNSKQYPPRDDAKMPRALIVEGYPAFDSPIVGYLLRKEGWRVETSERAWFDTAKFKDYQLVVFDGSLARAKVEKTAFDESDVVNVRAFLELGGTLVLMRERDDLFRSDAGRKALVQLVGEGRREPKPQIAMLQPDHVWLSPLNTRLALRRGAACISVSRREGHRSTQRRRSRCLSLARQRDCDLDQQGRIADRQPRRRVGAAPGEMGPREVDLLRLVASGVDSARPGEIDRRAGNCIRGPGSRVAECACIRDKQLDWRSRMEYSVLCTLHKKRVLWTVATFSPHPPLPRWSVRDSSARIPQPAHATGTFATPADAIKSPREKLAYVVGIYAGTESQEARLPGDHRRRSGSRRPIRRSSTGCRCRTSATSCTTSAGTPAAVATASGERRYLIVPGPGLAAAFTSSTRPIPREPKLHKVIEPEEVVRKTEADRAAHGALPGRRPDHDLDARRREAGDGPGGFLLLDEKFEIAGRWETSLEGMNYNYDFWYQPRHNVMVSSEWAAPNTTRPGFKLEDVKAGKYGQHLHFWDWKKRKIAQSIDLGEKGLIPLEVRFHHNPDSTHGFVGAALSQRDVALAQGRRQVEGREGHRGRRRRKSKGWPFPVPGLITDLVLSMDDRWLYFSNWLHGDVRQYDVSDPAKPKLTGQLWLGGVIGKGADVRRQASSPAARRCCSSASTASGCTSPTRSSAVGTTSSIRTSASRARPCCRSTATPSTAA